MSSCLVEGHEINLNMSTEKHTIQGLYSSNVITRKLYILKKALIPRIHDRLAYVGMFQTQTVSKLMKCHPI